MRVFLSSTFLDLQHERQAAFEVLGRLPLQPWGMELFAPEPRTPLDVALRELTQSDVVVVLLGFYGGSLIPEEPQLTYTRAEFEHAQKLGRRIFVFIQTENGQWVNKESDTAKHRALEDFRSQIAAAPTTPSYFESPDQLKTELVVAFHRWEEEGRPGARKTFATLEEFFAQFKPSGAPRLFDYEQQLLGRSQSIEDLDSFLSLPDQAVAILVGRGGIGKSKLLRDWGRRPLDGAVLFLQGGAVWHSEVGKELPVGQVLIVCDDAHRFSHLENLIQFLAHSRSKQNIKLLLSIRPSGVGLVDSVVARHFDTTQIRRLPQLEKLSPDNVRALAEEILGPSHRHFASSLALISADTPLVTVVGGRLIARGAISPQLLNNEEDFRREVFNRFSEEYERLLPRSSVVWRDLLHLLAALGPVAPRSDHFLDGAERFLGRRKDEILVATDTLEKHGLLMRGGSLVRIVPDVLADFLLEDACVSAQYEPTGYAEAVFAEFGGYFLSHLMRNLGELDWRISQKQPSANLLGSIWTRIYGEFEVADAAVRGEILRRLHGIALLQPGPVMKILRLAMETSASPNSMMGLYEITQENVLEEVPKLLEETAYYPEFLDESFNRLWILAKGDRRPPNQYPESAPRVLQELASYTNHKQVGFLERIAEFADTLLSQEGAFDSQFTPLDIIDPLLEKEGEGRESDGLSLRMWSFELRYEAIKHVRDRALATLEKTLWMDNPRASMRALKSLLDVLSGYLGKFGRATKDRERIWQDAERIQVLDVIERRLEGEMILPLRRQILSGLRTLRRRRGKGAIDDKLNKILDAISDSEDLIVFDAFCTNRWDLDLEVRDLSKADALHQARVKKAVAIFRKRFPQVSEMLVALEAMAQQARSSGIDVSSSSWNFVNELCHDPEFAFALAEHLRTSHPAMGQWSQIVLLAVRGIDHAKYLDYGIRFSKHSDLSVACGSASAILCSAVLDAPTSEDIQVLEALAKRENENVKRLVFMSLGRLGKLEGHKDNAVRILLGIDISDSEELADEMCSAMDYGNMSPNSLSRDQISEILKKLVPVKDLDEHHVGRFLDWVGRTYPDLLFGFILDRLNHYAAIRREEPSLVKYRPVPHHEIGTHFHSLRDAPDYEKFLRSVKDRLVAGEGIERWLLCDLFWAIGSVDTPTLSVLDEWLHVSDEGKLRAVLSLLSEAPERLALVRPFFAVQVVEACETVNAELGRKAIGGFVSNTLKGMAHGAHGEPTPKFVSIRDEASSKADSFPDGSAGRRLFGALRDAAKGEIESDLKRDADFDMRRGAL